MINPILEKELQDLFKEKLKQIPTLITLEGSVSAQHAVWGLFLDGVLYGLDKTKKIYDNTIPPVPVKETSVDSITRAVIFLTDIQSKEKGIPDYAIYRATELFGLSTDQCRTIRSAIQS